MKSLNPFAADLIRVSDVAKQFNSKSGKRLHVSTPHRWSSRGVGGHKLATIKIGGTRYTTIEELKRFLNAISGSRQAASETAHLRDSDLESRANELGV